MRWLLLVLLIATINADEIDKCLDAYGKVWDFQKDKCVKASDESLPYSKREKK